jgi:hypothetical protein
MPPTPPPSPYRVALVKDRCRVDLREATGERASD